MSLNKDDSDNSEEFDEEFSDDDNDAPNAFNYGLGLGHVRRLEQENELSRANLANIELKLIGSAGAIIVCDCHLLLIHF